MSVKIRLQRHGKKQKPFYWIVAADARSKRDGRYLEKLGTYNPNTNPATIDLNLNQAVQWLHNGAQPTDTAKAILSYKGALLKHHLDGGVRKGALTQEQADTKLTQWLEEKAGKLDTKKEVLTKAQEASRAHALKAEKVANDKRAAAAVEATKVEEVIVEEVTVETVKEELLEEAAETVTDAAPIKVEDVTEVATEEIVADNVSNEENVDEAKTSEEVEKVIDAESTTNEEIVEDFNQTSTSEETSEDKKA